MSPRSMTRYDLSLFWRENKYLFFKLRSCANHQNQMSTRRPILSFHSPPILFSDFQCIKSYCFISLIVRDLPNIINPIIRFYIKAQNSNDDDLIFQYPVAHSYTRCTIIFKDYFSEWTYFNLLDFSNSIISVYRNVFY